jgi:TAT (twin-arginine translocation) pathway signal sequence
MRDLSRRDVLRGAGGVAALGALAAALPRHVMAAEATGALSGICLSMLYPGGKGKFDSDRFRDKHLPLIRGIYGESVERIELRVAPPPARRSVSAYSAPPPAYLAAVNLWIRKIEEFGKHTAESGQQIQADLLKVSQITPFVQYDQTLSLTGESRADVPVGTEVASTFFPNRDGGRWDAKYFVDKYLPKVIEVYGKDTLRRIEVSQGRTGQGGVKAALIGSSHLYIRDRAAFDAAGRKGGMQLFQEAPNYTDIMSVFTLMKVHAAG